MILLMEEILHQLICSFSHYLQGFTHPRWLFGISEPSTAISSLSGYLTTRHLYSIFTKIPNFYNQLHTTTLSPPIFTSKNFPFEKIFPKARCRLPRGVEALICSNMAASSSAGVMAGGGGNSSVVSVERKDLTGGWGPATDLWRYRGFL